jgi:hypothetical protein
VSDPTTYISLIIGIVTFIGGVASGVYQFGFKNGEMGNILKGIKKDLDKYPLAEMSTQVKTMWDVYVMDALHGHPDLAQHRSPLTITEKGEAMIPDDIKQRLNAYRPPPNNHSATWSVINCLGMEQVTSLSLEIKLPLSLVLALLSVFYEKYHPGISLSEPSPSCPEPKKA